MTLPRPVLIAILGLALCAAAFLATRSANDTGSTVTAVPSQPRPIVKHRAATPAKPAKPAKHGTAATKAPKAVPATQPSAAEKATAAARAATSPQAAIKP